MVRPINKCFSTWQRGIPVATVAINNGTNTRLLAARILSAGNPDSVRNTEEYLKDLEKEVPGKVEELEKVGRESYSASRS